MDQAQLRTAARDYVRLHMAPAMQRVGAAAAAAARRPILQADTPMGIVRQITTEIDRLEDVQRATEMAGRGVGGPPTEQQIQDALDQRLVSPNDRPAARAIAAETARWAGVVIAGPAKKIAAMRTELIAKRRRLEDASSRASAAERVLAEARAAVTAESVTILKGWLDGVGPIADQISPGAGPGVGFRGRVAVDGAARDEAAAEVGQGGAL